MTADPTVLALAAMVLIDRIAAKVAADRAAARAHQRAMAKGPKT